MREIRMQSFKHDGRKHRGWVKLYELPGEPGVMYIEPGTPVVEANGAEWSSPFPVLYWVHAQKWYNVAVLCKENGTGYYCNIASPVVYEDAEKRFTFIDYDVDLIVNEDGVYEIVDEEELTEHAAAMKYPADILNKIAEATAELVAMFEAQEGPFDPQARERWLQVWEENKP